MIAMEPELRNRFQETLPVDSCVQYMTAQTDLRKVKSINETKITIAIFKYLIYLEPRRKPGNWLDSLDVQWSSQQILLWDSFAQSHEPRGLEVSIKGSLVFVYKACQFTTFIQILGKRPAYSALQ
jgi:hypothetical protein